MRTEPIIYVDSETRTFSPFRGPTLFNDSGNRQVMLSDYLRSYSGDLQYSDKNREVENPQEAHYCVIDRDYKENSTKFSWKTVKVGDILESVSSFGYENSSKLVKVEQIMINCIFKGYISVTYLESGCRRQFECVRLEQQGLLPVSKEDFERYENKLQEEEERMLPLLRDAVNKIDLGMRRELAQNTSSCHSQPITH